MPKDNSIKSVLIIGSGPIIIGQACEFDYSGTQAARSLREEGVSVTLINSNPATIMTDPMMAEMTATGGVILAGVAVSNLLELKKIRVGNFLPALAIAPLIVWILDLLKK